MAGSGDVSGDFNGGSFEASLGCVRADSHAPIGVMGDHLHKKGEWMLSYRYMTMSMDDNFIGTDRASVEDVFAEGFAVSPTDMQMQMHMVGLMYAPSDWVTLFGMVNFVEVQMDHVTRSGGSFRTESSGVGDSSVGALVGLFKGKQSSLHLGLSVLLPTAEIEEEDFLPAAGGEARLPYPMQLGSGSWGGRLALTWNAHFENWSLGSQLSALTYFDDNDQGYRLGDRYEATAWVAKPIGESFSLSFRVKYEDWGNISGVDEGLNPMMQNLVPTARADLRGGSALDLSVGVNFYETRSGIRLAGEYGQRVWQDLDGPQLGVDSWTTLGLQYAW